MQIKATDELAKQRIDICRACAERGVVPVANTEFCKVCGCVIPLKVKLQQSKCPQGKW